MSDITMDQPELNNPKNESSDQEKECKQCPKGWKLYATVTGSFLVGYFGLTAIGWAFGAKCHMIQAVIDQIKF